MTITSWRRLLVFAMSAIAFLALQMSDELSPLVIGGFWLALPVAWFWDEPRVRFERWATGWTAATLGFFAWTLAEIFFFTDEFFLVPALRFAIFLAGAKLFQLAENKDYVQSMALSLLLLAAGSVLNENLSFGVLFASYVITSTLGLTVQHLNVEVSEHHGKKARGMRLERAILGATLGLALLVFAGSVAFFFAFPRVGFGFFMQQSRGGVMASGFGESVDLGNHGTIREDATIVMRVVFPASGPPVMPGEMYFRGLSLDHYTGRSWIDRDDEPARVVQMADGEGYAIGGEDDTTWEELLVGTWAAEVHLEPMASDVLFSLGRMVALELPDNVTDIPESVFARRLTADRTGEISLSERSNLGVRYIAHALPALSDPTTMRAARWGDDAYPSLGAYIDAMYRSALEEEGDAAPTDDVDFRDPEVLRMIGDVHGRRGARAGDMVRYYLQLPEGLVTDRMSALVAELQADDPSTYDFVARTEQYLRSELGYTTDLPVPSGPDANVIDEFLFDWQEGHCEYFATTMVMLLRAGGVPARIVNGFLGADLNTVGNFYSVRQANAHTWVEAYFPHVGWVRFDPTPAGAADMSREGWGAQISMFIDNLRLKWFRWVVEYDLEKQYDLIRDTVERVAGDDDGPNSAEMAARARSIMWFVLRRARAVTALFFLGLSAAFLFRRRGLQRLPWSRTDWVIGAGWFAASLTALLLWWPDTPGPVALAGGLLPALLGTWLARQMRLELMGVDDGRRDRAKGSLEISVMYTGLLRLIEREVEDLPLSVTGDELIRLIDLENPEVADELQRFVAYYTLVRFSGRAATDEELADWRRRYRKLRRGVVRALRRQRRVFET